MRRRRIPRAPDSDRDRRGALERDVVSDAGTTSAEEPSGAAAPKIVPPVSLFSSPTQNIGCAIDKDYARCDISSKNWEAPGRQLL